MDREIGDFVNGGEEFDDVDDFDDDEIYAEDYEDFYVGNRYFNVHDDYSDKDFIGLSMPKMMIMLLDRVILSVMKI